MRRSGRISEIDPKRAPFENLVPDFLVS
ncbi:protein of unknown function [Denitratisoma oestradiolicum]|uniref:Uncharacterized protein n=1 Tax=Denitratisoma oestradiolicum TaxID=311182 RepID=A0A6S6XWD7_9PROT|nr:protein of unknown function [Denitratisoma oestradiolicum]